MPVPRKWLLTWTLGGSACLQLQFRESSFCYSWKGLWSKGVGNLSGEIGELWLQLQRHSCVDAGAVVRRAEMACPFGCMHVSAFWVFTYGLHRLAMICTNISNCIQLSLLSLPPEHSHRTSAPMKFWFILVDWWVPTGPARPGRTSSQSTGRMVTSQVQLLRVPAVVVESLVICAHATWQ